MTLLATYRKQVQTVRYESLCVLYLLLRVGVEVSRGGVLDFLVLFGGTEFEFEFESQF
jgi:hypothetical protein